MTDPSAPPNHLLDVLGRCLAVSIGSGVPMAPLLKAWFQLINADDVARESLHDQVAKDSDTLTASSGLMPTSDRFWAYVALIERDNISLYNKLRNLD